MIVFIFECFSLTLTVTHRGTILDVYFKKKNSPSGFCVGDIAHFEDLRYSDQQIIRNAIHDYSLGTIYFIMNDVCPENR